MTASLSSKIINWAGSKLSECWVEHGQSCHLTRFRQNEHVHDARHFDAYGFTLAMKCENVPGCGPLLVLLESFHS